MLCSVTLGLEAAQLRLSNTRLKPHCSQCWHGKSLKKLLITDGDMPGDYLCVCVWSIPTSDLSTLTVFMQREMEKPLNKQKHNQGTHPRKSISSVRRPVDGQSSISPEPGGGRSMSFVHQAHASTQPCVHPYPLCFFEKHFAGLCQGPASRSPWVWQHIASAS